MPLVITGGYGELDPALNKEVVPTFGYGGLETVLCVAPFWLDSVELPSPNVVRARFTDSPLVGTGSSPNRGDVSTNYTLTGPSNVVIELASINSSDSEIIDLYLDQDLVPGVWALTVASTLITTDVHPILDPKTYVFTVENIEQDPLSNGATNINNVVAEFLNPAFLGKPNWEALTKALSAGQELVNDQIIKSFDQLFLSTASGKYLELKAADSGIEKPLLLGIDDDLFRKLAIAIKNSKLTQNSMYRVLEVFYGSEATRAYVETNLQAPFVLNDNSTLNILVDESLEVEVFFKRKYFSILRRATGTEISAVINRAFTKANSTAFAVPHVDLQTGVERVRIFSGATGLKSSVRITGGTSQPTLEFSTRIDESHLAPSLPEWTITKSNNTIKFKPGDEITYQLNNVQVGDYVVITGHEFDVANRGSFAITNVNYSYVLGGDLDQWFEIENDSGVAETVQQCRYFTLEIFRPKKRILQDSLNPAIVSQIGGETFVEIPATTTSVNREETEAAYLQAITPISFNDLSRDENGIVTITTDDPHGLDPDDFFIINDFKPSTEDLVFTAGTPSGAGAAIYKSGNSDISGITKWSTNSSYEGVLGRLVRDLENDVWIFGGQSEDGVGNFSLIGNVTRFSVTEEISRQHSYRWFVDGLSSFPNSLGIAADVLAGNDFTGEILLAGGYDLSPWNDLSATPYEDQSVRIRKNPSREQVLVLDQLDDTAGIRGALVYFQTANPVSGDFITITDGITTRTYGFDSGGDVTVTIGASPADTMTNLETSINGDGSATFGATFISTFLPFSNIGGVVIWEDTPTVSKSPLRAFGTFTTQSQHRLVEYANDAAAQPEYLSIHGTEIEIPNADPSAGRAGFHRNVLELVDQEIHLATFENEWRQWDEGFAFWDSAIDFIFASQTAGTHNPKTDAELVYIPDSNKAVLIGGSDSINSPLDEVEIYDPTTDTWAAGTPLLYPRMLPEATYLSGGEVLVAGGRRPFIDIRSNYSFNGWNFEDGFATATFTGPVDVPRGTNPQPVGKRGWGSRCDSPMIGSAGAPQTAVIGDLSGDFTMVGWSTATPGVIIAQGNTTWATTADNTLVAFGIQSTNEFFVAWHDAGGTFHKLVSATPYFQHVPISHSTTAPHYFFWSITRTSLVGTSTWSVSVNGVGVITGSGPDTGDGSSGVFRFGDDFTSIDPLLVPFTGNVDEVGYTATPLTQPQIDEIYRSEVGVAYDHPSSVNIAQLGNCLSECEIIDETGTVRRAGNMTFARAHFGLIKLPDGRVLAAGGIGYNSTQTQTPVNGQWQNELKSTEIFDPVLENWIQLPNMNEAHSYPAIAYVEKSNRVYIAGGLGSIKTEYLDLNDMKWYISPTTLNQISGRSRGKLAGENVMLLPGGDLLDILGRLGTSENSQSLNSESDVVYTGGINNLHRAITASGTTITFETPNFSYWTQASGSFNLIPVGAPIGIIKGPYIWNPQEGVGIDAPTGTLGTRLERGGTYNSVFVQSPGADSFPDEPGWLIFNYGFENQVGPVKYLGTVSDSEILIDAGFRFTKTLEAGASVRLLETRTPFVPANSKDIGSFYVTISPAGRVAAEQNIIEISAAGIPLNILIKYPGDRGLGGEGFPAQENYKLSDKVLIWGSNSLDEELEEARKE